jgi:hypothetical protein
MKNCEENISATNSLRRRGHGHNNEVPGMLRLRATQNPTLAVNAGKNTCQNWPALAPPGTNCEGAHNIGPNPPAFVYAQANNVADKTVKIGELYLSNSLMLAIPFHMNPNFTPLPHTPTHTHNSSFILVSKQQQFTIKKTNSFLSRWCWNLCFQLCIQ